MRLSAIFITAITAALAAGLAYGQNPPASPKPDAITQPFEAEIIHVSTLTGDSFDRLVKLLAVFDARVQADQQLRTILVYAPKDVVAQMRRVVAELDTPGSEAAIGRNIEMTMTLLRCSAKAAAAAKPLPDDIEPVAKQLRATTQYKDIQLWDVVPLRLQEGKIATEEMQLPIVDSEIAAGFIGQSAFMSIRIRPDAVTRKGQSWSVRFADLNLSFRIPAVTGTFANKDCKADTQISWQNVGLSTAGDFLEGQKTVLGKVSGGGNDGAIFVVISLKVLD